MSSLHLNRVSVSYERRVVLAPFTCDVHSGEWLCLIGPNGAGKSSLLRAIAGLVEHDGDVEIDGTSLSVRSARRRATLVAYVSQFMSLNPGDIITTGTPPGVGVGMKPTPQFLKAGDVVTLGIKGLGEQKQKIVKFKKS